jgi:outer membrane lipoprotein-sorting protein
MSDRLIRFLRTAPVRRLVGLVVIVVAVGASIVAIASAGDSGPVPPPADRAVAIHNAISGPAVPGLSADVKFTNHLIDSSSIQGGDPLLTGGAGRLWVGQGGRFRLELQGDNGDPQITSDGTSVTIYDASANTAYKGTLPKQRAADKPDAGKETIPTLAEIQTHLNKLMESVNLSEAAPTNVGGRPAYSVKITPKHDAGLLGAAEVAWDSDHGTPLRVGVYAAGNSSPVLELSLSGISYSAIQDSVFDVAPPAGAKVVDFSPASHAGHPAGAGDKGAGEKPVTGVDAVAKALPFTLKAPDTLAGLPRHEVRLLDWQGEPAALVLYGQNLGGIAVIEQKADAAAAKKAAAPKHEGDHAGLSLPTVSINGTTGQELGTALGTVVRFTRGDIAYTIVGSVPAAAAEAAARDSGLN